MIKIFGADKFHSKWHFWKPQISIFAPTSRIIETAYGVTQMHLVGQKKSPANPVFSSPYHGIFISILANFELNRLGKSLSKLRPSMSYEGRCKNWTNLPYSTVLMQNIESLKSLCVQMDVLSHAGLCKMISFLCYPNKILTYSTWKHSMKW